MMRGTYFRLFLDLRYKLCYAECYQAHASRMDLWLTLFGAVVSAGSVAAWSVWKSIPLLWSFLVCAAQVLQICKSHLPYAKRLPALKYAIPDMHKLLLDVENSWNESNIEPCADEAAYSTLFEKYSQRYDAIRSRYFDNDDFKSMRYVSALAEKNCKSYFYRFYGIKEWSNGNV